LHDGSYDTEFLNTQPAIYESEYVRHVRFDKPIIMKVDGRKNRGVVMKP
jgi:hypothetical protein